MQERAIKPLASYIVSEKNLANWREYIAKETVLVSLDTACALFGAKIS